MNYSTAGPRTIGQICSVGGHTSDGTVLMLISDAMGMGFCIDSMPTMT